MPLGGLLRKRRRVDPGDEDKPKNWMAVDRAVAPLPLPAPAPVPSPAPATAPRAPPGALATPARSTGTVGAGGTPIAVDGEPEPEPGPEREAEGLEGDMLSRLLDLNAEHTRLQMLYEDLYARYALQKEQLAEAGDAMDELAAQLEKRDARIKVLRMTVRRLKGGAGSAQGHAGAGLAGFAGLPLQQQQQQQQQQFPDASHAA